MLRMGLSFRYRRKNLEVESFDGLLDNLGIKYSRRNAL